MPLGNARSWAATRTSRSGVTTPTTPGCTSPAGGPTMKSKSGLLTKAWPRPSTTMSLQPYDESGVRSAYGARVPSSSSVSNACSVLETSTSRPSGRKSKHIGSDWCSTTTSVTPASSTVTMRPPVQSLNHSRPSCHRGDSTRPKPEHRTSMRACSHHPPVGAPGGCGADRRRGSSHLRPEHVDLAPGCGRVEAVLDEPADRGQAAQRPPPADRVEVDVAAVAGDHVVEVPGVPERQAGEVVHSVALTRLRPVED